MTKLIEAATIKARAQGLLRAVDGILADKGLPGDLKTQITGLRAALKKKWTEMTADAAPEGAATEAERWVNEAGTVLAWSDSFDSRRGYVQQALMKLYPENSETYDGVHVRDLFDDVVVYQKGGKIYQADYTIDDADPPVVTLGEATEVEIAYIPVGESQQEAVAERKPSPRGEGKMDKKVGGGVDRDKIPAADFAGKDRSFPIVKPGDVSDAASSIGRAGADNYSADELKKRIIVIAKRKGASFVAELPKAWREAATENAEGDELEETEPASGLVELVEAGKPNGNFRIKLIQPGWGTYGYYSRQVLERDGPKAFPSGTKMFWDHQTAAEEAARPEGSLRNLAAELVEDARFEDDSAGGPGLYARAKGFGDFKGTIGELKDHIGTSIRAWGKRVEGNAEGRKGPVIESIVKGKSVDFVTLPGAGGKVMELLEAVRGQHVYGARGRATNLIEEGDKMADEKLAAENARLLAENAKFKEQQLLTEARDAAREALGKVTGLHDLTRARLLEAVVVKAPVTAEGALDRLALEKRITEAAAAEVAYIAQLTGSGQVRGMGPSNGGDVNLKEAETSLAESFARLGLLEAGVKIAVAGR